MLFAPIAFVNPGTIASPTADHLVTLVEPPISPAGFTAYAPASVELPRLTDWITTSLAPALPVAGATKDTQLAPCPARVAATPPTSTFVMSAPLPIAGTAFVTNTALPPAKGPWPGTTSAVAARV